MPRPSTTRSHSPYTAVPQANRKTAEASPVSSAITMAARRARRVRPYLATSIMAPMASVPPATVDATCTWLTAVCGTPGWSFGARPATMQVTP
jgi:hypothetical protein